MAGHFRPGFDRYVSPVRLGVAQVMVKRWKRSACADHPQIHGDAVCLVKEFLRHIHQLATQAGSLARRIHGEQPNIPAIPSQLDVDAAGEATGILCDQESSTFEKGPNAIHTGAITIEDVTFNSEGCVDQASKGFSVSNAGEPCPQQARPFHSWKKDTAEMIKNSKISHRVIT